MLIFIGSLLNQQGLSGMVRSGSGSRIGESASMLGRAGERVALAGARYALRICRDVVGSWTTVIALSGAISVQRDSL
jgi:hypothetical protein